MSLLTELCLTNETAFYKDAAPTVLNAPSRGWFRPLSVEC